MSKNKQKPQNAKNRPKQTPARTSDRFQLWWVLVAVAVLTLAGYWISQRINTPASQLPLEISVREAYQKYADGVFLLDVRTPEEWNDFHAPNTTLIPLDELAARVSELPQDQEIVVVCRSGNRSQQGRDILLQAGFKQVTSMAGGLNEWQSSGYPTVSGP